jgi:diguanylate cyclase (GGDEF)-like protein
VNPSHLVQSAQILMRGHKHNAVAVMESGILQGVLTMDMIQHAPERADVRMFIRPQVTVLPPYMEITKAAAKFVEEDLAYAVVMDEVRFYGIVSANMLLKELRRSWDPLTGLGWSDQLRDWGVEILARSGEITILFIDLDQFGLYNKQHGHLVGDHVLKRVSQVLKETIDPKREILVRYGGDEFAIGTTRPRQEAELLASAISSRSGSIYVDDASRAVSFSLGIAGGRRSTQRPDVHVASTFDELVNLASKNALAQKVLKSGKTI